MYDWLETAMNFGLSEAEFWDMTPAEYQRFIKAQNFMMNRRMQERALLDWKMADLLAHSLQRLQSSSASLPELHTFYSFLFDEEQTQEVLDSQQRQKDEVSEIRLKQFVESFNQRHKEVEKDQ